MPFEQRMREGLHRAATSVDPAVERSLHRVMSGRRRRRATRRILAVAAAGLVALVLVLGVPAIRSLVPDDGANDAAGGGTLAGFYQTTLRESDVSEVDSTMAGRWRMRLRPDGAVELAPPVTFLAQSGRPACAGNNSPCRYDAEGSTLRTNLVVGTPGAQCNSLGVYAWDLQRGRLAIRIVDDACQARRTLLSTRIWADLADPRMPEGVYRTGQVSLTQLLSAGSANGLDAARLDTFWRGRGVSQGAELTLRLEAGLWTLLVSADGGPDKVAWTGEFDIVDDEVVRTTEANVACGRATYRYRLDGRELRLDQVSSECGDEDDLLRLVALHESVSFIRQP